MSHIAITKIRLKHPNQKLLNKAVHQLARDMDGEVVKKILDYEGNATSVGLGIRTGKVHRGVGIAIAANGNVTFKGDRWQYEQEVKNLEERLIQCYTTLAVRLSLKKLGYKSISHQNRDQKVYVQAEV